MAGPYLGPDSGVQGRGPRGQVFCAESALVFSATVTAIGLALVRAPAEWTAAVSEPSAARHPSQWSFVEHAWNSTWAALDISRRNEALIVLLIVGAALAATWASYQLFRGRGRWLAAVLAGPSTATSLATSLSEHADPHAVTDLAFTIAATLGLGVLLRSLVHFGAVTPIARARSLALGAIASVLHPRAGLPLLGLLLIVCALRRNPHGRAGEGDSTWLPSLGVALGPAAVGLVALAWLADDPSAWFEGTIGIWSPNIAALQKSLPPMALYPGLALIGLLAVPLRWRGGWTVTILALGSLVLGDDLGLFTPRPAQLLLVSTAACGWVWLAGLAPVRSIRLPLAWAAAAGIATLAGQRLAANMLVGPIAPLRPTRSLLALYEKGLLAPGDGLFACSDWLAGFLDHQQREAGWRPDIRVVDANRSDRETFIDTTVRWGAEGRRVVSDSFTAGGRWKPSWVIDSGPIFWFVGATAQGERDLTDIHDQTPETATLPVREQRRWALLAIERSRFRRAIGAPLEALEALPLPHELLDELRPRLQLTQSLRPHAGEVSELPAMAPDFPVEPALVAEAGDLLFAYGEHDVGGELLIEAAEAGYLPAYSAYARWQLRAGNRNSGLDALLTIGTDESLQAAALPLLRWLIDRGRTEDARAMALTMRTGHDPFEEAAARLLLLKALMTQPSS